MTKKDAILLILDLLQDLAENCDDIGGRERVAVRAHHLIKQIQEDGIDDE